MVTDKPIEAAIPSREFRARAPEAARADVLEPVHGLDSDCRPGDRAPFDSRTLVHSAASSCEAVSVETPSETPARR